MSTALYIKSSAIDIRRFLPLNGGVRRRPPVAPGTRIPPLPAGALWANILSVTRHNLRIRPFRAQRCPPLLRHRPRVVQVDVTEGGTDTVQYGLESAASWRTPGLRAEGAQTIRARAGKMAAHLSEVSEGPFAVVVDCGNIIGPMIVWARIHGGLTRGVGHARHEDIPYDEHANSLAGLLMDYPVPRGMDAVAHLRVAGRSARGEGDRSGGGESERRACAAPDLVELGWGEVGGVGFPQRARLSSKQESI